MSHFTVSGRFQTRYGHQEFTKTVEAPNENVARDRIYSQVGSQHGVKRPKIDLESVAEAEEAAA
ncbi:MULTISPECIES: 50S ribosomal protein L18Ae [Halopenitus]|uniref:Large ribosomal subunit protein eL20 n=1 Tax=Halopenitus malekzadehii TaxID=1267564 RepID=A0A1H6HW04_9EURY|nr:MULTISPECIES: 50S ribosomal protein L18Ae [Halopenitus]SEH38314.1 large subunit ribosomal protein LX [Halopenitus malekzadehii]